MRRVVDGVRVEMTQEEIDAFEASRAVDPVAELAKKRAAAVLAKGDFCTMLKPKRANILSVAEAVQAARGDWPATFATFTSSLTEDQAADAQIKWAAATEVHYSDPLLQALALHWAGGDQAAATAILDQIFGISA